VGRLAAGARASQSGGDSIWGDGEEKVSLLEELHGGARCAGRCAGEGGGGVFRRLPAWLARS
jgi:hypothetical protein